MSIWGKLIGTAGGFALGGPIGALLGSLAGHAIDKFNQKQLPEDIVVKQIGFTIGVKNMIKIPAQKITIWIL